MKTEEQNGDIAKATLQVVVYEAILNDPQIKALYKRLDDLLQYNSPKYAITTDCEFKEIDSMQFSAQYKIITNEIEFRQNQIVSAYNY